MLHLHEIIEVPMIVLFSDDTQMLILNFYCPGDFGRCKLKSEIKIFNIELAAGRNLSIEFTNNIARRNVFIHVSSADLYEKVRQRDSTNAY